jgi:hypothetical protein
MAAAAVGFSRFMSVRLTYLYIILNVLVLSVFAGAYIKYSYFGERFNASMNSCLNVYLFFI